MREELRKILLNLYGIDIGEDSAYRISNIRSFMISVPGKTFRLVLNADLPREHTLARMMWADDLKLFKDTICEPIPSLNGNLIERIQLQNWLFSVSLYESAKGQILSSEDIRPMFLISAGDMLGTIHKVSQDQTESGMKFKLPSVIDLFDSFFAKSGGMLSGELRSRLEKVRNKAASYPKLPHNYGVCYAEYSLENIMVDTNNIHLFDFDLCSYGHFLYDAAAFFMSIARTSYQPSRKTKDLIFNNIIPWFRIGYSINKPCEKDSFDDLDLFMELRLSILLMTFLEQKSHDGEQERKMHISRLSNALISEDIYEGFDSFIRGTN